MHITVTNNNGSVVLSLNGRLDIAANAQAVADIESLLAQCGVIRDLTCDAGGLDYISSSGLRILMGLSKRYNNFSVVNCKSDVYQVFDLTGFTKIMPIKKALRHLSVDGCQVIGAGGVGTVYRLDEDTIIKVFREETTIDEVQTEITMAKESFVLGMPTAISYDIVHVGNRLGLVYELLNADTLSRCASKEPERIDEFARMYAQLFKQLHSIHVPLNSVIPSALEAEVKAVKHIGRYFNAADIDLLLRVVDCIPAGDRLLHCDLQTKNAMMQNGELMLIDMGEVGYGHPLVDLGHSYSSMVSLVGPYEVIIGMPAELGHDLWHRMIGYYFEGCSAAELAHRLEQIKAVSVVRNFSWLALSDSFPESLISECQQLFEERVTRHKDEIMAICQTLDDFAI